MRNTCAGSPSALTTGMIATMAIGASRAPPAPRSRRAARPRSPRCRRRPLHMAGRPQAGPRPAGRQDPAPAHPARHSGEGGRQVRRSDRARGQVLPERNGIFPSGIVGAKTWEALIVTVWKGSRGPAVSAVQIELNFMYGFRSVTVDGVFGHQTELAVMLFQKKYRLLPDGIVGKSTWNALVVTRHVSRRRPCGGARRAPPQGPAGPAAAWILLGIIPGPHGSRLGAALLPVQGGSLGWFRVNP